MADANDKFGYDTLFFLSDDSSTVEEQVDDVNAASTSNSSNTSTLDNPQVRTVMGGITIFDAKIDISTVTVQDPDTTWYTVVPPTSMKLSSGEYLFGYNNDMSPVFQYKENKTSRHVGLQTKPSSAATSTQCDLEPIEEVQEEIVVEDDIFTHDPLANPPVKDPPGFDVELSRANRELQK